MHSSAAAAASSSSFSRGDCVPVFGDFARLDPSGGVATPGGWIAARDFQARGGEEDGGGGGGAMYTAAATPFDQAAMPWQHFPVNNSSMFVDDRSIERLDHHGVVVGGGGGGEQLNLDHDVVGMIHEKLLQRQIAEEKFRQRHQQKMMMDAAVFYNALAAAGVGGAAGGGGSFYNGYSYHNPGAAMQGLYSFRGGAAGGGVGGGYGGNRQSVKQIQHLAAIRSLYEQRAALQASGNVDGLRGGAARTVCRFYLQGICSRGESCPFLHSTKEMDRSRSGSRKPGSFGSSINGISNSLSSMSLRRKGGGRDDETTSSEKLSASSGSFESDDRSGELIRGMAFDHSAAAAAAAAMKFSSLEEIEGQIYETAKDQHGCRFLQKKFSEGSAEEIDKIFGEVIDHLVELMTDPFGNYLVQKLLEVSSDSQRKEILRVVTRKSELVNISLNMHGTRAVQKLIETLQSPEQVSMVTDSLMQGVVTLIKDSNGNHVVQKCLQKLSNEDIQFIIDSAAQHCVEIATHRHGCCVLQRCVDYASGTQRHILVTEIAENALTLSQDQYGNYVVQYILELGLAWVVLDVIFKLEGNFALLAMQKFSSNVVEKCLKYSSEDLRARIIREIIASSLLGQLLQDPFANYVIQCALSVSKGSLHSALVDAIRPHVPMLRSSPYGKRILSRANINTRK